MSGLFVPEIPTSKKTKHRAQGSPFSLCFCDSLSLGICQHHAIAEFLLQGQFPCFPNLSNSSGERKPNPSCMTTSEEGQAPAKLHQFLWDGTGPRLTVLAFLLQRCNGVTTSSPTPAGLEQILRPVFFFAARAISGQLHPSPWALSGSDFHLHYSFCTHVMKLSQGKKTYTQQ